MPLKGQPNSLWPSLNVGGRRFGGLLLSTVLSNDQQRIFHASFSTNAMSVKDPKTDGVRGQCGWEWRSRQKISGRNLNPMIT